ncbi:hypothetical protein GCM10011399_21160 [Subtercola lobariae]|uniref:Uncharacterized protein n=1 Tax=Subtercola lobariae TaxID=1588641 RepID=A0A917B9W3_9MICO|nr:hypothetical protein GCM10011399_21160 [Subtercola lobariae]
MVEPGKNGEFALLTARVDSASVKQLHRDVATQGLIMREKNRGETAVANGLAEAVALAEHPCSRFVRRRIGHKCCFRLTLESGQVTSL